MAQSTGRDGQMRILHLSADYPDPLVTDKTPAVANLLALVSKEYAHRVYSLNRVGWRQGTSAVDFTDAAGGQHRAIAYGAPSRGLFLRRFLLRLADWIVADLERTGFRPELIHAHKLSVEGLVCAELAARLNVPYVLSVQGNTDLKIVSLRRDLRSHYRSIWHRAAVVFPFAPWAGRGLAALLGPREGPVYQLPCPGAAEARLTPRPSNQPVICTAFHFAGAGNKNINGLIRALALAAREVPDIALEVIGGGTTAEQARLTELAARLAPGRVHFAGRLPNADMQARFNKATAFALVSFRESFGMVFAEALGAGAPCLIPRDRAIDGYFPEGSVVLSAEPHDIAAIAAALVRLVREESDFKGRLNRLMREGGLDFLTCKAISVTYRRGLGGIAA